MEYKNNYAWCVLVMLNDKYACGAVTVAQSLRNVKTEYPIWCLVAGNVSPECKEFLRGAFDAIIDVPIISHAVSKMLSAKQERIYSSWIHASFTKWNIFNPALISADKVILLDADMLFIENCDDLFQLTAPALTFSSAWARPYLETGIINPYGELCHGALVNQKHICRGLRHSVVGLACMVLARPDKRLFDTIIEILRSAPIYKHTTISGFDEQLLAQAILRTNTPVYHIHQSYNWIVGKKNWLLYGEVPKTQQYYNSKPWQDHPEDTQWEDVKDWWKIANMYIAANPDTTKWFSLELTKPLLSSQSTVASDLQSE